MRTNFKLMSMAELNRIAKTRTEVRQTRLKALKELNDRENVNLRRLKPHKWALGGVPKVRNYVPDL